jgi:hypothetical protein
MLWWVLTVFGAFMAIFIVGVVMAACILNKRYPGE